MLGQIWDTKSKMGVPVELIFFLGHVVKNVNCPGKFRMDGHLICHFHCIAWIQPPAWFLQLFRLTTHTCTAYCNRRV